MSLSVTPHAPGSTAALSSLNGVPAPEGPISDSSDMKIRAPFSRSTGKSKSVATTAPPQTSAVERSSWIGEPAYDGVDSSPGVCGSHFRMVLIIDRAAPLLIERTKTDETLGSLELGLEGDFGVNSTTSEGDTEPSQPYFHTAPKKKRKRNKLRQLVSTETSHYDFDVAADMLDAHTTLLHKPSPREIGAVAVGEEEVTEEGSSPNTILPGNALQLHLAQDDPAVNDSTTTPATSFSSSSSAMQRLAAQKPPDDQRAVPPEIMSLNDEPPVRPVARVHFRSRVRITSGLHSSRHRHEASMPIPSRSKSRDDLATTASGSPSSSISAPIRYKPDANNALGPLGKRLSSLAESRKRRLGGSDMNTKRVAVGSDERTPFLIAGAGAVPDYTQQRRRRMSDASAGEEDEDLDSGLKREEDVMFGKWPWRVLNRHASPSFILGFISSY